MRYHDPAQLPDERAQEFVMPFRSCWIVLGLAVASCGEANPPPTPVPAANAASADPADAEAVLATLDAAERCAGALDADALLATAIKSAGSGVNDRIGNFHADQRHDDEGDDEGDGAHGNLREDGLVDIGHCKIEQGLLLDGEIGGEGGSAPGDK